MQAEERSGTPEWVLRVYILMAFRKVHGNYYLGLSIRARGKSDIRRCPESHHSSGCRKSNIWCVLWQQWNHSNGTSTLRQVLFRRQLKWVWHDKRCEKICDCYFRWRQTTWLTSDLWTNVVGNLTWEHYSPESHTLLRFSAKLII